MFVFGQLVYYVVCGGEVEGIVVGEQDCVDLFDGVFWCQQVGFVCVGCGVVYVYVGGGVLFVEQYGVVGWLLGFGEVVDFQVGDVVD